MNSDNAVADFLHRSSVYHLSGLNGRGAANAGGGLPTTSHTVDDKGAAPWHPDSPMFWVAAFGTLVIVGIVGFTGKGRVGPVKAGFAVGKE